MSFTSSSPLILSNEHKSKVGKRLCRGTPKSIMHTKLFGLLCVMSGKRTERHPAIYKPSPARSSGAKVCLTVTKVCLTVTKYHSNNGASKAKPPLRLEKIQL